MSVELMTLPHFVRFARPSCTMPTPRLARSGALPVASFSSQRRTVDELWREFFTDPSQWWDHRSEKLNARYPDFKHKMTHKALWLNGKFKPTWVATELAKLAPGSVQTNIFSWNTRLAKSVKAGEYEKTLELFQEMQQEGIGTDRLSFVSVLNACAALRALENGRCVHEQIIQSSCESDLIVGNSLINMYAKCGSIEESWRIFNKMPKRDAVSWNTLLSGLVKCGQGKKALHLFEQMQEEGVQPDAVTFVALLNACSTSASLQKGRHVHEHINQRGCQSNIFVGNSLIDMYSKCGSIEDAQTVFNGMGTRNVVTWNVMIQGYVKCGQEQKALDLSRQMQCAGMKPVRGTFVGLLKACASLTALEEGRLIHEKIIQEGLETDVFVGSSLVYMYSKCGSIDDASRVFSKMPSLDLVAWTSMINAYAKCNQGWKALELSQELLSKGLDLDPATFNAILNACSSAVALEEGRLVHERIIQSGYDTDLSICNNLIDMYAKCGSIGDAWSVFKKMKTRDVISWSAMIQGYVKCGQGRHALELSRQMQEEGVEPDPISVVAFLSACASVGALEEGRRIHEEFIQSGGESDFSVGLIDMYTKCGSIEDAWKVFQTIPERGVASWNAIIRGYVNCGQGEKALQLYREMHRKGVKPIPDTFVWVLNACASIAAIDEGRYVHQQVLGWDCESDVSVSNSLINMYSKCRSIGEAWRVFDRMPERNVVSWNVIIHGCLKCGQEQKALDLSRQVQEEGLELDPVTFVAILNACASVEALEEGRHIHGQILRSGCESDVFIGNSLIHMYAKCGSMADAWVVFNNMSLRDVVSWNTMILGTLRCGQVQNALELSRQMECKGIEADAVTLAALLNACATLGALEEGKRVHERIIQSCCETDIFVANSLIGMYAKCGSLDDASRAFKKMLKRDVASWNIMIHGYVKHGQGHKALELCRQMQLEGVAFNVVTLVGLLNACASIGALEEGKLVHEQIVERGYLSDPSLQSSLIDMYSKCGSIADAWKVFDSLPSQNVVAWTNILQGLAMHGLAGEALGHFKRMCEEGVQVDSIALLSLLSACSHSGLVEEGLQYFGSMSLVHNVSATIEHYACIVDLLGRGGRLHEAQDLIGATSCEPDAVLWMCLLGACRIHHNVMMAESIARRILDLDRDNAAAYVLLSNIYAAARNWSSSANVKEQR